MRHIIVHLIRSEAQEAHENITKDLAEKFDVFPMHERIRPHLTLKRFFELDDTSMKSLYEKLDTFTANIKQSDYSLTGFGNFGTDVIYLDAIPSVGMGRTVQDLMVTLHEIKEMTFDEYDNGSDFHATVAFRALGEFDYDKVWNYLQTIEQPNLKMRFDNIAVMKKVDGVWVVDRVWEIKE